MPVEPTSQDELSAAEIRRRLVDLIEGKRRAGVQIYHVSQIGSDLGVDTHTIESLTGQKLWEFIRSELEFKIGSHGSTGNALFVYFGETMPVPVKRPRFKKAFWDAFKSATDKPRFLNLRTFDFGSADDLLRGSDGRAEIGQEFLPSASDGDVAADITYLRIERWLAATGLDASMFVDERGHSREEPTKGKGRAEE